MLWAEKWGQLLTLGVVILVILTGILYSISLGNTFRYRDEEIYFRLAHNLVSQGFYSLNGQTPTAYRPPGYPFLLSLFMVFGATIIHLRMINFLALGGSLFLLYQILRNQGYSLAGFIGVLLVVCYPILFYSAGTLYPQSISSFLFLSIIFLLSRIKGRSIKADLFTGLLFGYLILTIPNFIIPLFFTVLWLFIFQRGFKTPALILIMTCLVIGCWSARNYRVFNSLFFISTNSGINLLVGNSENTTANSGVSTDISEYEEKVIKMDEVKKDAYFRTRAMEFIRTHKLHSLKLYVLKWFNHFNFRNELKTQNESSWLKDLIGILTYGPLLILFTIRLLLYKRFPFTPFEIYLILLYFLNAFYQAIFFTRIRFRIPFDFLLIIIVALFLYQVLIRMLERPYSNIKLIDKRCP